MPKYKDLTGQKFGRLTAEEQFGRSESGRVLWKCKCDCGNEKIVESTRLLTGVTKSCGCYRIEELIKRARKYDKKDKRLYTIWKEIRTRCNSEKDRSYKNYGGRGISMCDEWLENYKIFEKWSFENGYTEKLTIDRIDNDGNYYPENCRWATVEEQSNNRRSNRHITYNGERHTVAEWARLVGKEYGTVLARLNKGWEIEDVLFKEIGDMYGHRRKKTLEIKTEE